ncbi:MAG TPA: cyclic nucleotide-binding domain-containing protein [Verrucomicrobiota bacterium]|nr:cyclic nucleotide-binding protein [Verrucomicrobiales bacterium]HRI15399.1 cyclic nucleotide-binding domain-containing protein [Verrucomicrobiota bacterium]
MRKVLYVFSVLSDQDVDWLTSNGHPRKLIVGEVLVHEGRALDSLYVVLDGHLAITMAAHSGGPVARSITGEVIGEISFVDSRPPIASVVAETPCTVLGISQALVAERLRKDESFGARFYRAMALTLAHRLRKTMIMANSPPGPGDHGADELDDNILDNLHLAGGRFERMAKRLLHR